MPVHYISVDGPMDFIKVSQIDWICVRLKLFHTMIKERINQLINLLIQIILHILINFDRATHFLVSFFLFDQINPATRLVFSANRVKIIHLLRKVSPKINYFFYFWQDDSQKLFMWEVAWVFGPFIKKNKNKMSIFASFYSNDH